MGVYDFVWSSFLFRTRCLHKIQAPRTFFIFRFCRRSLWVPAWQCRVGRIHCDARPDQNIDRNRRGSRFVCGNLGGVAVS